MFVRIWVFQVIFCRCLCVVYHILCMLYGYTGVERKQWIAHDCCGIVHGRQHMAWHAVHDSDAVLCPSAADKI